MGHARLFSRTVHLAVYKVGIPPYSNKQAAMATVLSTVDAGFEALETFPAKIRDLEGDLMQALRTDRIGLPLEQAA
jgi:hypothetical protein